MSDPASKRRGVVFDKWPFRLDIAYEYQCWILVGASFLAFSVCFLPCLCGTFRSRVAKKFTVWVYTRLHLFFCVAFYGNLAFLCFFVGLLPDWTINQYFGTLFEFIDWVLIHTVKFLVSALILFAIYVLVRFKERIAVAAGVEHLTFFRLGKWNIFHSSKIRPIEVVIWKVEELPSGPLLKPNDVFLECHLGANEPTRTRVHHNAGAGAVIKESFQVNVDENFATEMFSLLVKDQELLVSTVLARLQVRVSELLEIEATTGARDQDFVYSEASFAQLNLHPRGKIWMRVNPVDEEEKGALLSGARIV